MDYGHNEWTWTSPGHASPCSGYPPSEERGVAHRGDTGGMCVGRDGRVIDLRVPTGREVMWEDAEITSFHDGTYE